MKVKLLLFKSFATKHLAGIALCTVFAATSMVSASDALLSKLSSQNNDAIEQCVKGINLSADDSIDTSSRLYKAGLCYFCVDCDFADDNGQLFQVETLGASFEDDIVRVENHQTAHKLMSQAAGLGSKEAYYGLAVLMYFSDLIENKKTKVKLSESKIYAFKSKFENEKLSDKETQQSIDKITKRIFEETSRDGFSQEIHKYLLVSAKQGYLPAQFALSEAYFNGIGVAPDEVNAYAWAATAVAQNPPFGSLRRDQKAVNLDAVELNEAEAMAERYMKNYTNIYDRSSVTVMR